MAARFFAMLFFTGILSAIPSRGYAQEPGTPSQGVRLSPALLDLLRAEMREIAGGVQGIALSLAAGDWKAIQDTSAKIRASYIMEKKLTPAQARELEQALPEHFKHIDAEFHERAEKLGAAAAAHDPGIVAFQYSRLVESCALCHAAFARSRFPGFGPPAQPGHQH